jgi:hypothetical protein
MDGHAGDAEHERASRRTGALGWFPAFAAASREWLGYAAKKAQTRENVLLALPAARMVNYIFR